MKKILVILVGLLVVCSIFATETRVASMGGVGFYMKDNSNVFYFPGTINLFSNQLIGEMRVKNSDNDYSAGLHLSLNDSSVLGFYVNNPLDASIPDNIFGANGEFQNVTLDNALNFFYGKKLSTFDMGVRFAYGIDNYHTELDTTEVNEGAHYYCLGIGLSNDTMDLGFLFEIPGAKYELNPVEETWGGIGMGLNWRMFLDRGRMQLVPVVTFKISPSTYKYDSGISGQQVQETKYSDLKLGLGMGLNYKMNENNLVVIGFEPFGFASSKMDVKNDNETTKTTIILPGIYAGVESQIKSWVTGRFGLAQTYRSVTNKIKPDQGNETINTNHFKDFALSFGLGFNFGRFTLDAFVNEGLFFDGPNFISGTGEPMATKLSLTYNFE